MGGRGSASCLWACFRVSGVTVARLAGRVAGFHGPGAFLPLVAGAVWRWSGGLWQGADAVPGGDDVSGPGPGGLDVEAALAAAAGPPGGGVQDAGARAGRRFASSRATRPAGPRLGLRAAGRSAR